MPHVPYKANPYFATFYLTNNFFYFQNWQWVSEPTKLLILYPHQSIYLQPSIYSFAWPLKFYSLYKLENIWWLFTWKIDANAKN
jgi:hypothetical protein